MSYILIHISTLYIIASIIGTICSITMICCLIYEFMDLSKYTTLKKIYTKLTNKVIVFIVTVIGIVWISIVAAWLVFTFVIPNLPHVIFV